MNHRTSVAFLCALFLFPLQLVASGKEVNQQNSKPGTDAIHVAILDRGIDRETVKSKRVRVPDVFHGEKDDHASSGTHGARVANIIAGRGDTPVTFYDLPVLSSRKTSPRLSNILSGLDWMIDQNRSSDSSSIDLAYLNLATAMLPNKQQDLLERALKKLRDSGTPVILPAGNHGRPVLQKTPAVLMQGRIQQSRQQNNSMSGVMLFTGMKQNRAVRPAANPDTLAVGVQADEEHSIRSEGQTSNFGEQVDVVYHAGDSSRLPTTDIAAAHTAARVTGHLAEKRSEQSHEKQVIDADFTRVCKRIARQHSQQETTHTQSVNRTPQTGQDGTDEVNNQEKLTLPDESRMSCHTDTDGTEDEIQETKSFTPERSGYYTTFLTTFGYEMAKRVDTMFGDPFERLGHVGKATVNGNVEFGPTKGSLGSVVVDDYYRAKEIETEFGASETVASAKGVVIAAGRIIGVTTALEGYLRTDYQSGAKLDTVEATKRALAGTSQTVLFFAGPEGMSRFKKRYKLWKMGKNPNRLGAYGEKIVSNKTGFPRNNGKILKQQTLSVQSSNKNYIIPDLPPSKTVNRGFLAEVKTVKSLRTTPQIRGYVQQAQNLNVKVRIYTTAPKPTGGFIHQNLIQNGGPIELKPLIGETSSPPSIAPFHPPGKNSPHK